MRVCFYTSVKYSPFPMGLPYRVSSGSNLHCAQSLCLPYVNSEVSHVVSYVISAGFQPEKSTSSL